MARRPAADDTSAVDPAMSGGARRAALLRSLALPAGVLLALAGCRESELDRPIRFTPGEYQGQVDDTLTDEQRRAIRDRADRQRF